MPRTNVSLLRPLLWLVAAALAVGVASYLTLADEPRGFAAAAYSPPAPAPTSAAWNLPKQI